MRTVTFYGLVCIAGAISHASGYKVGGGVVTIGAIIFVCAIMFDIVDFVTTLCRPK